MREGKRLYITGAAGLSQRVLEDAQGVCAGLAMGVLDYGGA